MGEEIVEYTKMSKEEFLFLKSVTDNFTKPAMSAFNDSYLPVPTPGYKVEYNTGRIAWANKSKKIKIQ